MGVRYARCVTSIGLDVMMSPPPLWAQPGKSGLFRSEQAQAVHRLGSRHRGMWSPHLKQHEVVRHLGPNRGSQEVPIGPNDPGKARDPIYCRRKFEGEIIELFVRWHITSIAPSDKHGKNRGLSASPGPRYYSRASVLPQSMDHEPTVVAAESDSRREPVESSRTEAVTTRESTGGSTCQ